VTELLTIPAKTKSAPALPAEALPAPGKLPPAQAIKLRNLPARIVTERLTTPVMKLVYTCTVILVRQVRSLILAVPVIKVLRFHKPVPAALPAEATVMFAQNAIPVITSLTAKPILNRQNILNAAGCIKKEIVIPRHTFPAVYAFMTAANTTAVSPMAEAAIPAALIPMLPNVKKIPVVRKKFRLSAISKHYLKKLPVAGSFFGVIEKFRTNWRAAYSQNNGQ